MLDLCCGRGGWTKGFQAAGWRCIGYDIEPQPDYPSRFIRRDVLTLKQEDLAAADFICASTPCQQFSCWGLPFFFRKDDRPPFPKDGLLIFKFVEWLLNRTGKPYVMENVRCAEQFVGRSVNHCGPFYLWGPGVPPLFPLAAYRLKKGFQMISGSKFSKIDTPEGKRAARKTEKTHSNMSARERREFSAMVAEIPLEISFQVAQHATRLLEIRRRHTERMGEGAAGDAPERPGGDCVRQESLGLAVAGILEPSLAAHPEESNNG